MDPLVAWGELPGWLRVALVGLAVVQVAVEVTALVVLFRTPPDRLVLGKRWPWVLLILFVNLVGAIVFLAVGRAPSPAGRDVAPPGAASPVGDRAARAADVLYGPRQDEGHG